MVYNIEYLNEMKKELDKTIERKQEFLAKFGIKEAKFPFSAEYQDIV